MMCSSSSAHREGRGSVTMSYTCSKGRKLKHGALPLLSSFWQKLRKLQMDFSAMTSYFRISCHVLFISSIIAFLWESVKNCCLTPCDPLFCFIIISVLKIWQFSMRHFSCERLQISLCMDVWTKLDTSALKRLNFPLPENMGEQTVANCKINQPLIILGFLKQVKSPTRISL